MSTFLKGLTAEIRNALLNDPYYDYYDLKARALSAEYFIKIQPCFVTLSAIHYNNKHTLSKLEELKLSNEQQEKIITQKDVNSLSLSLESTVTCLIKTLNRQSPIIDSASLLRTNNKSHMYKYSDKLKSSYTNTIRLIIHGIPNFQENIDNPKQSTLINFISLILQKSFRHCKNRSSSDLRIAILFFFFSFNVGKFQTFKPNPNGLNNKYLKFSLINPFHPKYRTKLLYCNTYFLYIFQENLTYTEFKAKPKKSEIIVTSTPKYKTPAL